MLWLPNSTYKMYGLARTMVATADSLFNEKLRSAKKTHVFHSSKIPTWSVRKTYPKGPST